jgi:hypothetical protein
MNGYAKLAETGAASIVIADLVLGQAALIAIAVGLVALGVVAVRFGFRRHKTPADI